jgi:hypothetical protein
MKRTIFTVVALAATSLWSIASATVVTYNFSGTTQNIGSTGLLQNNGGGIVFTTSPQGFNNGGAASTVTVYGETAPAGLTANPGDDGGPSAFGTTTGLFEVTNGQGGNSATGIAPYIPGQASGSSPNLNLTNENGVTETDVLLIDLRNITAGSTVSFVMATGVNATANTGINLWDGVQAGGVPSGFGTGAGTALNNEAITAGNVNGAGGGSTTKSFNISGTVGSGAGQYDWIAIQADCHYLVLQSLSITSPSGVPEPSFYGLIAVLMAGLVIGARKFRARTAEEKA